MALTIKETELSPSFTTEQRKILRKLLQEVYDQVFVDVINSLSLNELSDVIDSWSPVDKDVLRYDSVLNKWENSSPQTPVVTLTSTAHNIVASHNYSYLRTTNASSVVLTLNPYSSESWPDYSQIEIEQGGDGQITVTPGSGVTLNRASAFNLKSREKYSVLGLKMISQDSWVLFGDLEIAAYV